MKRPRKKYRHDPGKKWENPILRQAEAAGMNRWKETHFAMMDGYENGSQQEPMIVTLSDIIVPVMKAMEGWDDPDGVGDVLADAMDALRAMAEDQMSWHACAVPLLKRAVSEALQVTNGMPVTTIAESTAWMRAIAAKAERDVRALAETRHE